MDTLGPSASRRQSRKGREFTRAQREQWEGHEFTRAIWLKLVCGFSRWGELLKLIRSFRTNGVPQRLKPKSPRTVWHD